jgi:hypothetical protein
MVESQKNLADNRQIRRMLAGILLFAVVVRILVALYYGDWLPEAQDDYSYSELALRLAAGHGFSFAKGWYPFTPADTPTAHWSFLYTAYAAAIYAVAGYHPVLVRIVGALLSGLLLPWSMFRFAGRLFPNKQQLALLAAAMSAVYAYFILYAARIMTESFFIIALLCALERALALKEKVETEKGRLGLRTWSAAVALGLCLGIAALLRQSVLPWAAALIIWLIFSLAATARSNFQRIVRIVPIFVSAFIVLAFILPFTIRNYLVYDEFLLLNSNAGYAMYSAQHPMHGVNFQAYTAAPLPEEIPPYSLNEAQWDRELMKRGIGFILADPGRYLLLSASRVLDYMEFWPTETTLLHNIGRLASITLFLPLFGCGIWLVIHRARQDRQSRRPFWRQPVSMVLLFIIFYSLLHIFTWAMSRYRLPVDAAAIPFASYAVLEMWPVLRRHFIRPNLLKHS